MILYINDKAFRNTLFVEPIKGSKIRLVSCRFVNKLYNLPKDGTITDVSGKVLVHFSAGNWTLKRIRQKLASSDKGLLLERNGVGYAFKGATPVILSVGMLALLSPNTSGIIILTPVPVLSFIYINCGLIDEVLYDGVKSKILCRMPLNTSDDITEYSPEPLWVSINARSITSLNLWIADCDGPTTDKYEIYITLEIV